MRHREASLADEKVHDLPAARLAREARITEEQAGELIERFGTDWDSLLNEAHFLKELEGRLGQE